MSFLIALMAGLVLTPILGAFAVRVGMVDRPGELKIHEHPTPISGGVAVSAATLLGVGLIHRGDLPWVAAAVCVALGGGLADDHRPLAPWVRVVIQAVAGTFLVAAGLRLEPLGGFGAVSLVVVTVACCNAVNMLDGQDGLAAGLSTIAALGLGAVLAAMGVGVVLPLALAGGLLGFLAWNRPPARVFLGDGGAYAVGVFLAVLVAEAAATGWNGLLAAAACLGVFAYELISTVVRRSDSSVSAIRGDRGHSYDRLSDRLGSRIRATLVMWSVGLVAALVGLAVVEMPPLPALALIASVTLVAILLDARLLPVPDVKGER